MDRLLEKLHKELRSRLRENEANDILRTKSPRIEVQNVYDKAYEINEEWIEEYREAIRILKDYSNK